ncbi:MULTISPECIES: sensor domain-containing diguanylate cyclase [Marinobacter]|jgi:diguanylate cyclase (GGDEF)-like protein|uniref:diguanylate cyclase n=2 Tax=Marinobacter TaxID=2742 RepID=A0A352IS82_9GAMM|nr:MULTISPECIES: sensor domain-containing diguanylate cyclase [Marinobacter]MEC7728320.1 diguanylate cyclase [Pseudomonadota bacterium]HAS76885.1 sensor domain-containing diguanylate cyclase [Marinobacter adhaerens]AKV96472.1 diguanylate cyclase [Marinobacter sp. CP1]AXS83622.1 sensor domain-containing diguanylate cyclase [Marinobacter sp. Arc7-DN-1]EHJ02621.1 diguanylate cyclase [Marinobacter manganoxydans MnI7-9]|tara:strand:+ start:1542 stop:2642 length:1101 start_codon:yes stop_codon:yes gene_type:complete
MNTPHHSDLGATLEQSRSGLRDSHRRSLMRLLFLITGSALVIFACLQFLNGYPWVAVAELFASTLLFFGVWRLKSTPHLQQWVYAYLVPLFAFFLVIMLLPEASVSAFVWVLMMPVLAYLLLGKKEGMILSAPFMLVGGVIYYIHLGQVGSPHAMIDLLNMVLCGALMLAFIHLYEVRREESEQRLVDMAQTDALTGLANRSNFQGTLNRTIAECDRSGAGFALVVMDIDHFKVVNDTLGHEAGDFVLKNISRCMTERLRSTDFVGRLGGEEFGLILRDVKPADAFVLMDELRQRISDLELPYGEARIRVTASFGIAQWPDHGREAESLFRVADRWLYSGKRAGRNCVVGAGHNPRQLEILTVEAS